MGATDRSDRGRDSCASRVRGVALVAFIGLALFLFVEGIYLILSQGDIQTWVMVEAVRRWTSASKSQFVGMSIKVENTLVPSSEEDDELGDVPSYKPFLYHEKVLVSGSAFTVVGRQGDQTFSFTVPASAVYAHEIFLTHQQSAFHCSQAGGVWVPAEGCMQFSILKSACFKMKHNGAGSWVVDTITESDITKSSTRLSNDDVRESNSRKLSDDITLTGGCGTYPGSWSALHYEKIDYNPPQHIEIDFSLRSVDDPRVQFHMLEGPGSALYLNSAHRSSRAVVGKILIGTSIGSLGGMLVGFLWFGDGITRARAWWMRRQGRGGDWLSERDSGSFRASGSSLTKNQPRSLELSASSMPTQPNLKRV